MHEYIARPFYYLEVHLLYASLVWIAAWILTSLRTASATAKYWIWVATSFNFIFPMGAALDKVGARHLSWATPISLIGAAGVVISENLTVASVLGMVWLLGAMLMMARLCFRISAERRKLGTTPDGALHNEAPDFFTQGVPVRFAVSRRVPAVDGVLHPRISLPSGIEGVLTGRELDAVLLHELAHAKRRDNLVRLIHEVGLCILWFHPLMWMTGSRLALYRELSCDESVIEAACGHDLVSALAKLANPEGALLLEASASSFLSDRLTHLRAAYRRPAHAANLLLVVLFAGAVVTGVYGTVAHTACCFISKVAPGAACERK